MDTLKVLFTFEVWDELKTYLIKTFGPHENIELIFPSDGESETILSLASDADILFGWRPSLELLQVAEKMKLYIQGYLGFELC